MHARSMGADAVHVKDVSELKSCHDTRTGGDAHASAGGSTPRTTAPLMTVAAGGKVAIPEVSTRSEVKDAHDRYIEAKKAQRL